MSIVIGMAIHSLILILNGHDLRLRHDQYQPTLSEQNTTHRQTAPQEPRPNQKNNHSHAH